MNIWNRIKTLWWLSGIDFKESVTQEPERGIKHLIQRIKRGKMATIVETKDPEDLFANVEEDGNTN